MRYFFISCIGFLSAPLWLPILFVGILYAILAPLCRAAFETGQEIGSELYCDSEFPPRAATPVQRKTEDAQ
jgi:hypothetical protein